jgi:hypothetical protein
MTIMIHDMIHNHGSRSTKHDFETHVSRVLLSIALVHAAASRTASPLGWGFNDGQDTHARLPARSTMICDTLPVAPWVVPTLHLCG